MPVIVYNQVIDLLALHRRDVDRYPHLLGSASVSPLSRYSLLFAAMEKPLTPNHFLTDIDQQIEDAATNYQPDPACAHLPFRGGWFVYLGYEFAAAIEPILTLDKDVFDLPAAIAVRAPVAVIVDHVEGKTWLMAESDDYLPQLDQVKQDIDSLLDHSGDMHDQQDQQAALTPIKPVSLTEDDPHIYLDGISRIRDYIEAGDIFQVNLSRAWQVELDESINAADLYAALAVKNPAPFSSLVNFPEFDFSIASSSPERLVRVKQGVAETRPIAGTRPRSQDADKDQQLMDELIGHAKEQAEHIMLLDLERNDLGRICQPGTVEVNELMTVESYQHVHHIVSNVRGKLRDDITPMNVLKAVFPGGTITGCPKVRCMQIIAELERCGRGPYTGSVGYINHNGEMDFNILIRTFVQQGRRVNFRTGGGIVYDSLSGNELDETRHKAKGLLSVFSPKTS